MVGNGDSCRKPGVQNLKNPKDKILPYIYNGAAPPPPPPHLNRYIASGLENKKMHIDSTPTREKNHATFTTGGDFLSKCILAANGILK
jgi:hypothetical protein